MLPQFVTSLVCHNDCTAYVYVCIYKLLQHVSADTHNQHQGVNTKIIQGCW